MSDSNHAILPPSSAKTWVNCTGSPWVEQQYPNRPSAESKEGDAAHWVASSTLEAVQRGEHGAMASDLVGKVAPNGVLIDEGIAEGAAVHVTECLKIAKRHGALRSMLIEQRVAMPRIHPTDNWGTVDFGLFAPEVWTLYAVDFKFGRREVKAFEAWQLIDYVEGLVEFYGLGQVPDTDIKVIIGVVQPRVYRPQGAADYWETTLAGLRGYMNRLHVSAHQAFSNPTTVAGPWCRDCAGRADCQAATLAAYRVLDHVEQPIEINSMDGRQLSTYYADLVDCADLLKGVLDGVKSTLEHRIKSGKGDTDYTIENAKGRKVWKHDPDTVIAMFDQLGMSVAKTDAMTPRQVIDSAPAEQKAAATALVDAVSYNKATSAKLTPCRESRVARAFKAK